MARGKATITLDRDKVATAIELVGGRSMSEVVDLALDRLIRAERLRRDIEAYGGTPPTKGEMALGRLPLVLDLDDDDIDYDALYGDA